MLHLKSRRPEKNASPNCLLCRPDAGGPKTDFAHSNDFSVSFATSIKARSFGAKEDGGVHLRLYRRFAIDGGLGLVRTVNSDTTARESRRRRRASYAAARTEAFATHALSRPADSCRACGPISIWAAPPLRLPKPLISKLGLQLLQQALRLSNLGHLRRRRKAFEGRREDGVGVGGAAN